MVCRSNQFLKVGTFGLGKTDLGISYNVFQSISQSSLYSLQSALISISPHQILVCFECFPERQEPVFTTQRRVCFPENEDVPVLDFGLNQLPADFRENKRVIISEFRNCYQTFMFLKGFFFEILGMIPSHVFPSSFSRKPPGKLFGIPNYFPPSFSRKPGGKMSFS